MTPTTPKQHRPLALDEVKRLLAKASGHPDEPLLMTALATGLRRGELLALRWSDLDLEQGTLAVRRAVDVTGHEAEPKTAAGCRMIVLPGVLIEVLRQQGIRQNEAKQKACAAFVARDLVFASPSGGFRDPAHLRRSFHEIAEDAGMPKIGFHALRQTTTFLLLSLGVPTQVVLDILGLRRTTLPLSFLSPVSLALHREAMAKLDTLVRTLLPPAAFPKADEAS